MSTADLTQRLAAILAADAAGYSRLMSIDDMATVTALDAARAVLRTQIEAFRGRGIHTTGDGHFAAFDSPARAMHCAAVVVRERQAIGGTIRAGLHTGEVESLAEKVSGMALHRALVGAQG